LIELFNSAMLEGKLTGEIPLRNGRTFFANLSPVSAGDGNVVGWVATMQDVSHFKELNQLKNDFVNTVSHDLRSPLSGILLAVNMVSEVGQVNSDQRQLLQVVEKRVKGMSELIDDLLDVGKIEAGIDMEMEPQNITAIIEDVTVALTPQLQEKNIQYNSLLDESLPPVLVNAARLRQVIYNLVGNAIKYTNDQGCITVKAFAQDGEVRVQVGDTGTGIPASDQPHIFEKFYRVRGEHTLAVKGTGLGLAIAKSIVEKHHGRIWLESVFGEGSTFTLALPVYDPFRT
jgi:signal transduction histidine kinase